MYSTPNHKQHHTNFHFAKQNYQPTLFDFVTDDELAAAIETLRSNNTEVKDVNNVEKKHVISNENRDGTITLQNDDGKIFFSKFVCPDF